MPSLTSGTRRSTIAAPAPLRPSTPKARLEEMRSVHMPANVVMYNAAISACEKATQPDHALEVFVAVQEQGMVPDIITYNALISACEKGKQANQALEAFGAML